ncbi:DET1 homolog [Epargyreus clarus]
MNTDTENVYYEDIPPGALNEEDFICTEKIVPRKIKPQNIVMRLMDREIYGSRKPGSHFHVVREFYQNVFPNLTLVNVEKPPCFLRKFSPDGKHFIAFSADQTSLEIYEYRGGAAAGDLVAGYPSELLNDTHHRIRTHIFYRFFRPKHTVNVCQHRLVARSERNPGQLPYMEQQLNRECSLFTEDGRYVIVGSAAHIPEDLRPHFYHIHSNNEAVTPTIRSALEDFSLHLVDLHQGKLCDTKHFRIDKIYLSHNQGIYLYKEVLAVLSVQHQTIHLFQIVDGMLIEIRKIGRFCYDDDPFIVSSVFGAIRNERPFHEETINSLKHRLLVFLYKRAKKISDETRDPLELRKFYKYFDMFKSLRMWKMQLLDEDHLFIKYASEEVVTLRVAEPNIQSSFFVIYNISESKILEVYENTSEGLLQLFENYCDCFRNARLCADSQFTCSPSNNLYARLTQQRFKQTIVRAIYGGRTEATKRILAQLPISAQSYSGSPYLDLGLFSYDDKWVSVMERPKVYGEYPIRFYARDSGLLKFKIYAGILGQTVPASARRLVAFTFHPTDPFAISVQRTNSEFIVNFPYPEVVGEGDVISLTLPDGRVQCYFLPTNRRDQWIPYNINPNIHNSIPVWSNCNNTAWFVRSIVNPYATIESNPSVPNHYGSTINSFATTTCNINSQSQDYVQKFHNDGCTSTTDLHYFYPHIRSAWLTNSCAGVQVEIPKQEKTIIHCGAICSRPCYCNPQSGNKTEIERNCTETPMSVDDIKSTTSCCCNKEKNRSNNNVGKRNKNVSCAFQSRPIVNTSDKAVTTYADKASSCTAKKGCKSQTDIQPDMWFTKRPRSKEIVRSNRSLDVCDSSCCLGSACCCNSD